LRDHPPHLVLVSHLISDADPVVFLVFQNLEGFVSQPDTAEIANEDVENPVIPPALREIRQLVLERVFQQLKSHRQNICHPEIANDESFAKPSDCVSYHKTVHFSLKNMNKNQEKHLIQPFKFFHGSSG
jgi:hypothetical protein